MKIGIDLGGSHIAIAIVENGRTINKMQKKITDEDKLNIIETIEQTIFVNAINIITNLPEGEINNRKLESIGIAVPGTVTDGTIVKCINLKIENYNIAESLNNIFIKYAEENNKQNLFEKLPLEINLKNDAKCAAIAENEYGALKGYANSIFLTLGTGIGGAVIIDGKLLEGKNYPGYEFGHMTINANGPVCNCGKNGCFELYGSMKRFKTNLKQRLGLSEFTHGEQLSDLLKYDEALEKHDERIYQVIDEYTTNLAIGMSNLINIFEPEAIRNWW